MIQFDDTKNVIDRMASAYNLKTMKALCEYFEVGISVLANRVVRNTFPAEYVIQCSLETGADLLWLCTGQGESGINGVHVIKKIVLSDDVLEKLERLNTLKEKGAITVDEFNILKANLI